MLVRLPRKCELWGSGGLTRRWCSDTVLHRAWNTGNIYSMHCLSFRAPTSAPFFIIINIFFLFFFLFFFFFFSWHMCTGDRTYAHGVHTPPGIRCQTHTTHKHPHTNTNTNTDKHRHRHKDTQTHRHRHTDTGTYTDTHMHTHTRTHTHQHTHRETHARTHTRTHFSMFCRETCKTCETC